MRPCRRTLTMGTRIQPRCTRRVVWPRCRTPLLHWPASPSSKSLNASTPTATKHRDGSTTRPDLGSVPAAVGAFMPVSRTALCTLGKTPDQIVKVLWQRLLVKDLVHRPKPLAQPVP